MQKILYILSFILILSACGKTETDPKFVIQNFNGGLKISLTNNSIATGRMIDVNKDNNPDYNLEIIKKDGTDGEGLYITIVASESFLQVKNPFVPVVPVDFEKFARGPLGDNINLVRFAKPGDDIDEHGESFFRGMLSKKDDFEVVQPTGEHYFPVLMKKEENTYRGWMHLILDGQSVTIKKIVFCTIANTQIKIGQENL